MTFLDCAFVALIILLPLCLLHARRKASARAQASALKGAAGAERRNAIRRSIVSEADRLCDLDDEIMRFAEGSNPGLPDDASRLRADKMRDEAARLRAWLEAECVKHSLPIALVRRRRHARRIPTAGILGHETAPRTEP